MLIQVIFLIISLITLWWGAEVLVNNSSKLAKAMALSPAFIGLNVGLITSFPELTVSIVALFNDNVDIVIGNVVGSNIANIALIIGVCAVIAPVTFTKSTFKISLFVVLLSLLVTFLAYCHYSISFFDGFFLIIILFLFWYKTFFRNNIKDAAQRKEKGGLRYGLFAAIGTIILVSSARLLIYSATNVATELGVSAFFISLSVIALGTSLPELVTSVVALTKGHSEICVGNILGSNIYNILVVLGGTSLIKSLPIERSYITKEFVWFYGIAILFSFFFFIHRRSQKLGRLNGIIFLALYTLFIYSIIPV